MKASEAKLLDFLKRSPQLVIPIYQRIYSWEERECWQLWEDILRTGRNDKITGHFVGSIVYVEKGIYSVSSQSTLLVIDGQQRLTTIMLLLEALARSLGDSEPLDGFSARKLRNYYLLNPEETGDKHFKLILSQTDKPSLTAILTNSPQPPEPSIRVEANFQFFKDRIDECKDEVQALCKGLAKLIIVDISLHRDQDNPQLIFESLNSTGLELSQADLIRNFILMGLDTPLQTRLYEQYWRPMEIDFGQEGYNTYFDGFMRHYLTVKTGEIPNVREVYEAFKKYYRSAELDGVESLVADLRRYAGYYCSMALNKETDKNLKNAYQDLRELRVDVAFPLLLELYHDYSIKQLSKGDFLEAIRLVEAYVFRRAVCSIPTNSMNKTFATFSRGLNKKMYLEGIQARFLLLPSYRRFPSDDEFRREIQRRDLYHLHSRGYWLRRLENYGHKEHIQLDDYTIEHIMPQNPNLSREWREDLGPDWERVQKTWLHTLGNLTLTGYNPEYSDQRFIGKRDMNGGFAESPLFLNKDLRKLEHWNETEIRHRAERLTDLAVEVWHSPNLEAEVLDGYRAKSVSTGHTIEDHPQLASGPMREVFEAFRKQVLAIDPCVIEEFYIPYVAYKAETNFVDVVPQAKRLRLKLNMAFPEINDPQGKCRDVTGLGLHGNGDIEVGLSSLDELPYVMSLVRQSFQKQMGNGSEI